MTLSVGSLAILVAPAEILGHLSVLQQLMGASRLWVDRVQQILGSRRDVAVEFQHMNKNTKQMKQVRWNNAIQQWKTTPFIKN